MRTFTFTPNEIEACGGIIGYPEPGCYVIAVQDGLLRRGERLNSEHMASAAIQRAGLARYGPADDEIIHVRLNEEGAFVEYDYRTLP